MKKAKVQQGTGAATGEAGKKAVDEYMESVAPPARGTMKKMRAMIRAAAPPEAMEAIGYGIPTFRYKGALVAYGAFSDHCSLFPMSMAVIEANVKELKKTRTSKGTIQFPLDKALPAGLVKKMVKARVAEKDRKKRG
ncbi:MAG TPA: DUF1801 domain-containing protein [Candidatus Acidoferrum sp.]